MPYRGAPPARYGGHRRPLLEPYESELRALVLATPDITLAELRDELERRAGITVGLSTVHNALHRLGLRYKKSMRAAEQDRPVSPRSAGDGAPGRPSWIPPAKIPSRSLT